MSTHVSVPARKSEETARHDREVGGAIAFTVFVLVVGLVALGLRKLRARVLIERADRELREEIDRLEDR